MICVLFSVWFHFVHCPRQDMSSAFVLNTHTQTHTHIVCSVVSSVSDRSFVSACLSSPHFLICLIGLSEALFLCDAPVTSFPGVAAFIWWYGGQQKRCHSQVDRQRGIMGNTAIDLRGGQMPDQTQNTRFVNSVTQYFNFYRVSHNLNVNLSVLHHVCPHYWSSSWVKCETANKIWMTLKMRDLIFSSRWPSQAALMKVFSDDEIDVW